MPPAAGARELREHADSDGGVALNIENPKSFCPLGGRQCLPAQHFAKKFSHSPFERRGGRITPLAQQPGPVATAKLRNTGVEQLTKDHPVLQVVKIGVTVGSTRRPHPDPATFESNIRNPVIMVLRKGRDRTRCAGYKPGRICVWSRALCHQDHHDHEERCDQ